LVEGQRVVTCRYCGGKSLALIPDAVPRYTVRLSVTREQALEAVTQCLRDGGLPQALRQSGRIQEVALCYVPFYEAAGTRLGRFLLRQQEKPPAPVTEGKDEQGDFDRWRLQAPKETQDTRVVRQDYIRIGPACDLPELGVDRIHLEELRRGAAPVALEDFDLVELQRGAVVFAPVKPPAMLVEEVERRIPVRGDRTTIVERRITLLYYPIWQARYTYRGRSYDVAIDGVQGTVLRARAPREFGRAAALAVAMLAVSAFCFGRPARELFMGGLAVGRPEGVVIGALGAVVGLGVGGAVASLLAWIAWTTFRRQDDVLLVEGTEAQQAPENMEVGEFQRIGARLIERWLLPRGRPGGGR
jgi:hypothetical protein